MLFGLAPSLLPQLKADLANSNKLLKYRLFDFQLCAACTDISNLLNKLFKMLEIRCWLELLELMISLGRIKF